MKTKISGKTYDTNDSMKVFEHNIIEGGNSIVEVLYLNMNTSTFFLHKTKHSDKETCETITPMSHLDFFDWKFGIGSSYSKCIESGFGEKILYNKYFDVLNTLSNRSRRYVEDIIEDWKENKGLSVGEIKSEWNHLLEEEYGVKDLYNCLDRWEKKDYDNLIEGGLDVDKLSKVLMFVKCGEELCLLKEEC